MTTLGYKLGAPVLLQLGQFQFSLNTAVFQSMDHNTEYRWPGQERIGHAPALQFLGPGEEPITLPGVIYPEWKGGLGQIETLREIAATGQPQLMIDGRGNLMGRWVIERIDEKQSVFAGAGTPRKQEFTIQLKKYVGDSDL